MKNLKKEYNKAIEEVVKNGINIEVEFDTTKRTLFLDVEHNLSILFNDDVFVRYVSFGRMPTYEEFSELTGENHLSVGAESLLNEKQQRGIILDYCDTNDLVVESWSVDENGDVHAQLYGEELDVNDITTAECFNF